MMISITWIIEFDKEKKLRIEHNEKLKMKMNIC